MSADPIGVLDSGVGGLSVLREIRAQLPHESIIYIADQGHVPYGPRPIEQVRGFVEGIARFLIAEGVKLIVVGCNAASAAALYHLRDTFPQMPFVGMEPAVKPAAQNTKTGVIGVIATEATFQGELYASVVGRFAHDIQVEKQVCPEFVLLAEAGETDTPAVREVVHRRLKPMVDAHIDQLVIGCTHFPFLRDAIQAEVGPGVTIIDPAPAVARQTARVLADRALANTSSEPGHVIYYTSGELAAFRRVMRALLGSQIAESADTRALVWREDYLEKA
jgi:glutamate racemase